MVEWSQKDYIMQNMHFKWAQISEISHSRKALLIDVNIYTNLILYTNAYMPSPS